MALCTSDLLIDLSRRMALSSAKINIFWYKISEDRCGYQKEVQEAVGDIPIIPVVLRVPLFLNPNSFLSDLLLLLEDNKSLFEKCFAFDTDNKKIGILLLTHSDLAVSRAMSPICLPSWFPIYAGETEHANIEDITWTAEVALNSIEAHIEEICSYLCELEGSMIKRMLLISLNISDY
jgi:hypothetical protein